MNDKLFLNLRNQADKLFRHNRKGAYTTRSRYYEAYLRFLRYLADTFRLQKIANTLPKHLVAYVRYMQDKGMSASTIKTDLAAIRFWHDEISAARYVLPPNDKLDLERRHSSQPNRAWSQEEYERLVQRAKEAGRNDYGDCILLAWEIGLRIHEIMRIDAAIARDAVKTGTLTIKGKGGKERQVKLTAPAKAVLQARLNVTAPGQKLFVPQGKQTDIAIKELQNFIRKQRDAVQDDNREVPMTMHGGRHSYASNKYEELRQAGKSEDDAKYAVSRDLGHNRKDVTNMYLAKKAQAKTTRK